MAINTARSVKEKGNCCNYSANERPTAAPIVVNESPYWNYVRGSLGYVITQDKEHVTLKFEINLKIC